MDPSWPLPAEVAALADQLSPLIRFGCSSWTYPGWTGLIYQKPYPATGAGAKMLAEYARWPLFRTVGIDSFFYTPPSERTLASYAAALPAGLPLCQQGLGSDHGAHLCESEGAGPFRAVQP